MYKVLHITTHCGGGVGDTMFSYFSENKKHTHFQHEVVILGYASDKVIKKAKELDIPLQDHMDKKHKEIIDMIPNFDIVLIHQWNHPLLYDFLLRNKLPPCRLVMWGHNSGFHAPNIYTEKILMYPDLFVFTTPLTYKIEDVFRLKDKTRLHDIWSAAELDKFKNIKRKKHKGFNIGYIGTVDYAKLHPDFLEICEEIDIPNVKFIVVGGTKEKEIGKNASEKFEFTGIVPNLEEYLEIFDVFGYPLAPYHYGTCDLVLQIAMASGIVPVVFNNPMEKYMIKNNKTGIVAKDKKEYLQGIKDIYNNPNWHKQLSNQTREEALKRFSLEKLYSGWEIVFNKLLELSKTSRKWDIDKLEITAKDVFLESLGHYGGPFIHYCSSFEGAIFATKRIKELGKIVSWQTETKGSVHNYHSYFPDDPNLAEWSRLMKRIN